MTDNEAAEKQALRLTRLAAQIGASEQRGPAPVERWNPPHCGKIDMRIAADGTWYYEGTPIKRPALVALFGRVLRHDPDGFVLVTPVERVGITVEDAPFVAVAMELTDEGYAFVTNLGDVVTLRGPGDMRFAKAEDGGLKPYVHVRRDLWARLTRSLAIELLDRAICETIDQVEMIGIRSGAHFYAIGPANEFAE
jgi:hypothetical protein